MLFAKADDAERSGAGASLNVVRLFFTAAILFDATAQFTDDGELDPVAAEKRNYARYIAVRMKKALDSGTPYMSPNAAEHPLQHYANEEEEEEEGGHGEEGGGNAPQHISTQPPSAFIPRYQPPAAGGTSSNKEDAYAPPPAVGPSPKLHTSSPSPQPQPASMGGGGGGDMNRHSQLPQRHQQQGKNSPAPPALSNPSPPAYAVPASPPHATYCGGGGGGGGGGVAAGAPSIDAMITAQKHAKQAVSALQFYDHATARKELLAALSLLKET
ncbi:vacuolar protein sorting-associated protein VTA1 [Trypanosoma grayi]|uniref:vacuolar protein sorting-associated protein VTA1 n=1 Tax=Trypanosoma grayi TaxID=71804 RepID=UPI0004F41541|nr:vacuolar protein sorting-associated protein VTA1 [Trypanosoma grayi]KEG05744.1 vacuolar protein sorting-associated protein VTA1 [Trypanosoma grayi]